jgi:hypothetical protein
VFQTLVLSRATVDFLLYACQFFIGEIIGVDLLGIYCLMSLFVFLICRGDHWSLFDFLFHHKYENFGAYTRFQDNI